jgi:hypothetical protein
LQVRCEVGSRTKVTWSGKAHVRTL